MRLFDTGETMGGWYHHSQAQVWKVDDPLANPLQISSIKASQALYSHGNNSAYAALMDSIISSCILLLWFIFRTLSDGAECRAPPSGQLRVRRKIFAVGPSDYRTRKFQHVFSCSITSNFPTINVYLHLVHTTKVPKSYYLGQNKPQWE